MNFACRSGVGSCSATQRSFSVPATSAVAITKVDEASCSKDEATHPLPRRPSRAGSYKSEAWLLEKQQQQQQQQQRPQEQRSRSLSITEVTSEVLAARSAGDRTFMPQAASRRGPSSLHGTTVAARSPQTPGASHQGATQTARSPLIDRSPHRALRASQPSVAAATSPQRVTTELLGCLTVSQLYACLSNHREAANGISVAAALTRLAKLVDGRGGGGGGGGSRSREESGSVKVPRAGAAAAEVVRRTPSHHADNDAEALLELATDLLQPHLPHLTTRGYANAIWACSKCFAADARPTRDGGGGLRSAATACAGDLADAMLMLMPPSPLPPFLTPQNYSKDGIIAGSKDGVIAGSGERRAPSADRGVTVVTGSVRGGVRTLFSDANAQDVANACYGLATIGLDDHAVWEEVLLPRALQVRLIDPHSLILLHPHFIS